MTPTGVPPARRTAAAGRGLDEADGFGHGGKNGNGQGDDG